MPQKRQPQRADDTRPRERAPRGTLSRERIVRAAWAVLEQEGVDALTMRRVARELGVGTMSLYRHFAARDDLVDALTGEASAAVLARAPREGPLRTRLRDLFVTLHDALQEHPEFVTVRLRSPILTAQALRFTDTVVRMLLDAGLSSRAAVRAYRALYFYTLGCAAFARRSDADRDDAQTAAAVAALPLADYPGIAATRDEIATAASDPETFAVGLDLIIDSVLAGSPSTPEPGRGADRS